MQVVDKITRKLSNQLDLDEDIVDQVIAFQWKSTRDKMQTCNSIEITGLGSFLIRTNMVQARIDRINSLKEHKYMERYLQDLEFLKTKI